MGALHESNFTSALYEEKGPGYLKVQNISYSEDKTEKEYSYWKKGKELISFRARPLPGCCGVLVVYYMRSKETERYMGLYGEVLECIKKAALKGKYGCVLMTLLESSKEAIGICFDNGWKKSSFNYVNGKTNNEFCYLNLNLKQPKVGKGKPSFRVE